LFRSCATRELTAQLFDDSLGNLGLDGEDVLQIARVIFRPSLFARVSLSESGRDAHDVASLAHTSFDQMRHAQFLSNFLCRRIFTFEGKGRSTRGNVQSGNFLQHSQQLLANAVRKIFATLADTEIGERQYGDRLG